ncbi:hypothetical protein [Propionibacterium cyclohexanicum]|uniref:hypothetical protein n=1 Tax=Propionibacterium cyclohexanicum TaxID=64702 RepID=UPI001C4332D0|nr:hypothetical protein [Propionibacterium cyclohexanicum]
MGADAGKFTPGLVFTVLANDQENGRDELLFVLDRHWKRAGKTFDPDDFTEHRHIG